MKSKFTILKSILLVALLIFWLPFFMPSRIRSTVPFENIVSRLTENLNEDIYARQTEQALRRYIGVDPAQFENIAFYRIGDAMSACELLVAQSDSPDVLDQLEEAVNAHTDSQSGIYAGYAPEQEAQVNAALKDRQTNYYLYYIGNTPNAADMDALFQSALRGN